MPIEAQYHKSCLVALHENLSVPYAKSTACPESSRHLNKNFTALFFDKVTAALVENKETLIARYFNCNYNKVPDQREIKDMFKLNGFKQLIKSPTRKKSI